MQAGVTAIDGLVADIGVSSMQLDQQGRGFAFSSDGPLDMRMSQEGPSAADFCNEAAEEEIANVLYNYAEERQSRHPRDCRGAPVGNDRATGQCRASRTGL
jgi:16S rRNA (cytosine1402-N4)-methyltransferase